MALHEFGWFADRLDLARWESQDKGSRSGFFACPVHGGSDSLHVTEKNGKALAHCFACGADAVQVAEALESGGSIDEVSESIDDTSGSSEPVITIARGRKGPTPAAKAVTRKRAGTRGVRLPAASINPLDWMAARCGIDRAELDALVLPLSDAGGRLVFDWPNGATKSRGMGEGKKEKSYAWGPGANPPLWPYPDDPGEDIVVCEGEADAICLRHSGLEAYSITKGSSGGVPIAVWEAMREQGVETVRLLFDADDAGRKARAEAAEGARYAGLHVLESRVAGIDLLLGEKDARDVALRLGYPLVVEDDVTEDLPVSLADVDAALPEDLLLDRIHPQEHTILYGDGGTGKGVIAAWWVARLTREGMTVLVVDYEYHMNFEWRPRVEGFGGDMEKVAVLQPEKPIWEIAGWLRTQAAAYDVVVVDSVTYACVGEEVEKSVTATKYSMAVNLLGKPVLSIAHVTKTDAAPNHPFGSVFWSNGARVTVNVSRLKAEDPESPRVLKNTKTNQRGPFPSVAVRWDWLYQDGPPGCTCSRPPRDQRGMPHHLHEEEMTPSQTQMVREALADLRNTLGRDPTGQEAHTWIATKYGSKAPPIGTVRVRLSSIINSAGAGPSIAIGPRGGGSQDDDAGV